MISRRKFLGLAGAATLAGLAMPHVARAATGSVVVVGGGFGGATAARYLKRRSPELSVTLVEPATRFYTCPFSNVYLGGLRDFESIGHGFDDLARIGVNVVHDVAEDVDGAARTVRLGGGSTLSYDKLVLSPGVDLRWGALAGYDEAAAEKAPHAWKAGPQTRLLKAQLEAMPDGGTFVLVAPDNPYRCPPGPYERVSMIAHYFRTHKPASKILILDSKDAFSKQGLFTAGWNELYPGMIEWVSRSNDGRVIRVDADTLTVETEFGRRVTAAVLNVVPPQQAGFIAGRAGVTDASGWVPIRPETMESRQVEHIHVIGDATVAAPMPKSGFIANSQGKVAAAAIVALLEGREPPAPSWANTCYSMIGPDYGISVAGVYGVTNGAITEIAGGVSPASADPEFRAREAVYAEGWYRSIAQDIWGTA